MLKLLVTLTICTLTYVFAQTVPFGPQESLPEGKYAVFRVIDGDTFSVLVAVDAPADVTLSGGAASGGMLSGGAAPTQTFVERSVRIIGADSPEVRPREPYSAEATAFAQAALESQTVHLTSDAEPIDRYGRALAYVTLPDGTDYSLTLLQAGLAEVMTIAPNTRYAPLYKAAEAGAESVAKGLWAYKGFFVDRNCPDFRTQDEAQVFFEAAQTPKSRDRHRLDGDGNGQVCTSLPRFQR